MWLWSDLARKSPAVLWPLRLCKNQGCTHHPIRPLRNTFENHLSLLFKGHIPKEWGSRRLNSGFHSRNTGKEVTSGQVLETSLTSILNGLDFVRWKNYFFVKGSALEYQKTYDIFRNFRKIIAFLFCICLELLNIFQLYIVSINNSTWTMQASHI